MHDISDNTNTFIKWLQRVLFVLATDYCMAFLDVSYGGDVQIPWTCVGFVVDWRQSLYGLSTDKRHWVSEELLRRRRNQLPVWLCRLYCCYCAVGVQNVTTLVVEQWIRVFRVWLLPWPLNDLGVQEGIIWKTSDCILCKLCWICWGDWPMIFLCGDHLCIRLYDIEQCPDPLHNENSKIACYFQSRCFLSVSAVHCTLIGPIPWGHSGPLCHVLSLSSLSLSMSWT